MLGIDPPPFDELADLRNAGRASRLAADFFKELFYRRRALIDGNFDVALAKRVAEAIDQLVRPA